MRGCWLVAARACVLWLLAGRGAGHWGVLAGGSPARRLLLAWSRRVRAAARRSGHCRAWGSVSRALGPKKMSAALSRRSLCPAPPRPAGGASFVRVRGVARAPRDLPERAASRIRALLRLDPPNEGGVALRRERIIKTPCDRAAAGAAQTRRSTVSSPRAALRPAASRRPQPNAVAENGR